MAISPSKDRTICLVEACCLSPGCWQYRIVSHSGNSVAGKLPYLNQETALYEGRVHAQALGMRKVTAREFFDTDPLRPREEPYNPRAK